MELTKTGSKQLRVSLLLSSSFARTESELLSRTELEVQLQTTGSVRAKARESSSDGDVCLQAHLFHRYMGDAIYTEVPLNERHPP